MRFIIGFVVASLLCIYPNGLDVSFIPNDENAATLPLSAKYRDTLRRLCTRLKSGDKLPNELVQKKKTLTALCLKLEKDDKNIASAHRPFNLDSFVSAKNFRRLMFSILGLGGGFFVWIHRQWIFNLKQIKKAVLNLGGIFKTNANSKSNNSSDTSDHQQEQEQLQRMKEIQEAREARLKRFSNMDQLEPFQPQE
eukprot:gene34848-45093_t